MNEQLYAVDLPARNPKPDGKTPVILMLHGYGSQEQDLFSFAKDFHANYHIISLRAPLTLGFGGYAWYEINWTASGDKWTDVDSGLRSLESLDSFIENIEERYPVDGNNITLFGFSQGAIMSYAYSFRKPEKLKAVIAMSGYIVKELMPQKAALEAVKQLPFYVVHGSEDPVIPVSWAEQGVSYLGRLGIQHVFRKYPMPHGINPEAYHNLKDWMRRTLGI